MNTVNMDKIEQTITYGSVYEAIVSDFITPTEILEYLIVSSVNINTMIAYRAVCQFSKFQVTGGGPFILLNDKEEYDIIYYLSINEPIGRNDEETFQISKKIHKISSKLIDKAVADFVYLICDINIKGIPDSSLWIMIASRSVRLLMSNQKRLQNSKIWLLFDHLDSLHKMDYNKYEKDLLHRCNTLKDKALLYWNGVAKPLYQNLVSKNLNLGMDKDKLREYHDLFPELVSDELLSESDFKHNMRKLPETVQAYVLGYPIHEYVPSKEVLNKSIEFIDKEGIDKYCESIRTFSEYPNNGKYEGNTEDALTERISDYNRFDVIKHENDTHVYYFTRPEFPQILEKKKNTWSNEYLPLSVILEINHRMESSVLLKLPDSLPLKDLLTKVKDGSLTIDRDKEPSDDHKPQNIHVPQLPSRPVNNHQNGNNHHHGRLEPSTLSVRLDDNLFRHLVHYHQCPHQRHPGELCPHLGGGDDETADMDEMVEVDENGHPIEDDSSEIYN